ncbi:MAG: hypothetical protein ACYC1Z_12560 [Georgenia sp.]
MPKKKHRPLLREFERFARDLDLFIEDSTWLVEAAIRLKADHLGSPDPAAWTADEIRAVLTELFPREPLDAATRRLLVPTVTLYFGFLGRTGRWDSPLDEHALTELMAGLAGEMPRAFAAHDTAAARRTAAARPTDAAGGTAEPAGSTARRAGAEATGDPPADAPAAGSPEADPDLFGPDVWPAALGPAPDPGALRPGDADPGEQADRYERSLLVRRARALLAWVADRRPQTPDGELTAADCADVVERLDLPGPRTSMWANPELATLWVVLLATGHLEIHGTTVDPGRALPGPAEPTFVDAATRLHATVLRTVLHRPDAPRLAALLLGAVLRAAEPGGLTLVGGGGARGAAAGAEEGLASAFAMLAAAGVLDREGETYRLPVERHAVVPLTLQMLQVGR